jgi:alpha-tubulin suppressor-like RCC1 family protein
MRNRLFPGPLLVAISLALGACGDAVAPGQSGDWSQVAAGDFFTCGLTTAGKVYCWGSAVFGQLGNDDVVSTALPVAVAGDHTFRTLAAGSDHACGLDLAGAAWCWGLNDYRELGAATTSCNAKFVFVTCARVPLAVSGARHYDSIVVAGYSTCALSAVDTWCWGWNVHGQVGSGPVGGTSNVPARIPSSRQFVALTLDISHACGLTATDSIYCWGSNIHGQLAADTLQTPRCPSGGGVGFFCTVNPVHAAPGLVATRVGAGSTHTCALAVAGEAYCWGSNEYGVLGNSSALGGRVPVLVSGAHAWTALSAGADHTCALETEGAAWCWGVNTYGQLGVPTVAEACHAFGSARLCRTSPIAVASAVVFADISAGSSHTCGLTPDGAIWCWGRGLEGQLGNGATQSSSAPVLVASPGAI